MKINTTENFNEEPEPKKLSICVDCGKPIDDNAPVFIDGAGKIELAGPLVGVKLEEVFELTHVECPS